MSGSRLLGLTRTIPYLVFTFVMMPIQAVALVVSLPAARRIPLFYHRWAARLLGLRVVTHGTPSAAHPTLFVSNHTSYFDIVVLGSLIEVSFIAKADMINWPLFGRLAKLQRSVFVDRKPSNAGEHAGEIAGRLAAGDSLVLFAEGTNSDGNRLLPFKSALFTVAEQASLDRPLTVQPVSIVATALDGMPLGRSLRSVYAWFGDMPLLGHVWEALCLGRLTVTVEFHPAFAAEGIRRKALAERCHAAVLDGVSRAICGRYPDQAHTHRYDEAEEGEEIDAAA